MASTPAKIDCWAQYSSLKLHIAGKKLFNGFGTRARDVPRLIEEHSEQLASVHGETAQLIELEQEKWPKREELDEKLARLASIVGELEREASSVQFSSGQNLGPEHAVPHIGPTL